ncbi:CinA family protein [Sanguibacter sp. HDW7]|uniref:CinA family protein n=1 Tax=Sanguibacter sp. HDW7 TaxID=2714931 RepID=UPI00140AC58A|nr:CinA family protein [Sanguibacter sp. HDW7]
MTKPVEQEPGATDPLALEHLAPDLVAAAGAVLAAARERGLTVAVAESLTGGLVCSALVTPAGASDVVRGGIVAYATDVKASVLGVDRALLATCGPVDPEVVRQMALGVARVLGARCGVATTGVAGPGPQDGVPAGRVHVAASLDGLVRERRLDLPGDRTEIRARATAAALEMLHEIVTG